jgi:hypothetical protein
VIGCLIRAGAGRGGAGASNKKDVFLQPSPPTPTKHSHRQRCSTLFPVRPRHGALSSALRRVWLVSQKELATPKFLCLFLRPAHISTTNESKTTLLLSVTGIFLSLYPLISLYNRTLDSSVLSLCRRKFFMAILLNLTIKTLSGVLVISSFAQT